MIRRLTIQAATLLALVEAGFAAVPKWPDSWKDSYPRFERFVETRARVWPDCQTRLEENGSLSFCRPAIVAADRLVGLQIYRNGYTQLGRFRPGKKNIREIYGNGGDLSVVVSGSTDRSYMHFGPFLRYRVTVEDDKVTCLRLPGDEEGKFWPNWRALLFQDYVRFKGGRNIYVTNDSVEPSLQLKVDHQARVHRTRLEPVEAEHFLRWRIYHNGVLVVQGPVVGEVLKPSSGDAGHYLVMLTIEGESGWMPVSNYLTYYVYPEDLRSPDSLIEAIDTDGDGVPDFVEQKYGSDVLQPGGDEGGDLSSLRARMSWEFIPGYFTKRPWVLESDEEPPR